jgi:hypothetical protein
LARFVCAMLDDPDQRHRLGEHAAAAVRRHASLPALTAEALLSLLPVAAEFSCGAAILQHPRT